MTVPDRPEADLHAVTFALAEYATVENGRVFMGGGFFSAINLPSYPALTNFYVVAVLYVPWHAYHQDHKFAVYFEDADKNVMDARFEGDFRVGADPQMRHGDPTVLPITSHVSNLLLPRPGDYASVLQIDGTEISRWKFRAIQVMTPGLTPPGDGSGSAQPGNQGQ